MRRSWFSRPPTFRRSSLRRRRHDAASWDRGRLARWHRVRARGRARRPRSQHSRHVLCKAGLDLSVNIDPREVTMHALPLRRFDVDWLRVFAVYLLFVFHTAMVFNPAPFYHIRNADLSFVMLIVAGFISLWHMPLFFLLAGWSAHASLAARGPGGFVKERILKLWVPLVMGSVLLMPPIKYVELRSGLDANYSGLYVSSALQPSFKQLIPSGLPTMPPFNESFWEFLPP